MQIEYSRKFEKAYEKSPDWIQEAFDERLVLFVRNQFEPLLYNHALTGSLRGCRSFNVTGDWRAIFEEREFGVRFVDIGTHSQLYKK